MFKNFKKLVLVLFLSFLVAGSFVVASSIKDEEAQKLVDGNMEMAGTASWGSGGTPTLSKQTASPHGGSQVLRVLKNVSNNPYVGQALLTPGVTYRIRGWVRSDGSATPRIRDAADIATLWGGTTSTSWQYFDFTHVATGTYVRFVTITSAAQYVEWDDVVITPYSPPIKNEEAQILADGNMEAAGTASYSAWRAAISLAKSTTNPHGGMQCLTSTIQTGFTNEAVYVTGLTVGKTYKLSFWGHGDGVTGMTLYEGAGGLHNLGVSFTSSTDWQYRTTTFTAQYTVLMFYHTGAVGTYIALDDIYITEYAPPMKNEEAQLLADGNMETSGTDAFTASGSSTLSKQTTDPKSGTQYLRATYGGLVNWGVYGENSGGSTLIMTVGQKYRLRGWGRVSDPSMTVRIQNYIVVLGYLTTSSSWTYFDVSFTALYQYLDWITTAGTTAGFYFELDDVTLTLINN